MKRFKHYTAQRWLALSLLAVVLMLVLLGVIMPLVAKALALNEEKASLLFRLQRYQRIIDRKDEVFANIDKLKAGYRRQGYFSRQETAPLASADLQQVIKNAIATAGGQLTSTQVLPPKKDGEFTGIAVKVRMSGDIRALRSVLYQIETAMPLLVIDELDVRPQRGRRNRRTRKIVPSNQLNITFQVSAFMSQSPA